MDVESVAGHLLPQGGVFAFLAAHRRELFPDEMFVDLFASGRGRPSIPADVIAAAIVLQTLHGLSDSEAVEAVTFDLRWKAACGLAVTAPGFHPTVLTYWRRRLAYSERPRRIFDVVGQVPEQPVGIGDQGVDQQLAGGRVVPGDSRLPRPGVVMGPALLGDHLGGAGHVAGDPADRGDQLGDGVLGGHRVIQHRGIQRPAGPAGQHPGLGHHRFDRVEDPVRAITTGQSTPPIGQRGRVEGLRGRACQMGCVTRSS